MREEKNYYLLYENEMVLHLNKLESPSPKDALCVWLKLTQRFWRRRFLNSLMYFCYIVITPLGKGRGPLFEQIWIPFTQRCIVPSLVEIGPVVLEKKMKTWKVYYNKLWQQTNFDLESSLEPSAKIADIINVTEYQPTSDLIMIAGNWTDRIETL